MLFVAEIIRFSASCVYVVLPSLSKLPAAKMPLGSGLRNRPKLEPKYLAPKKSFPVSGVALLAGEVHGAGIAAPQVVDRLVVTEWQAGDGLAGIPTS